jgi:hypothetical protein
MNIKKVTNNKKNHKRSQIYLLLKKNFYDTYTNKLKITNVHVPQYNNYHVRQVCFKFNEKKNYWTESNYNEIVEKYLEDMCKDNIFNSRQFRKYYKSKKIVKNFKDKTITFFYEENFTDKLNNNHYLIHFENGVYDMNTFTFRNYKKEDNIIPLFSQCKYYIQEPSNIYNDISHLLNVEYKELLDFLSQLYLPYNKNIYYLNIYEDNLKKCKPMGLLLSTIFSELYNSISFTRLFSSLRSIKLKYTRIIEYIIVNGLNDLETNNYGIDFLDRLSSGMAIYDHHNRLFKYSSIVTPTIFVYGTNEDFQGVNKNNLSEKIMEQCKQCWDYFNSTSNFHWNEIFLIIIENIKKNLIKRIFGNLHHSEYKDIDILTIN